MAAIGRGDAAVFDEVCRHARREERLSTAAHQSRAVEPVALQVFLFIYLVNYLVNHYPPSQQCERKEGNEADRYRGYIYIYI